MNQAHSRGCLWLRADLCCITHQCWLLSAFWLRTEDILVCKDSGAAKITHQLQTGVIIHPPKFWGAVHAPPLTFPLLARDDRDGFKGSSSLPAVDSQDYLEGNVAAVAEHGNICMSRKDKMYPSHWPKPKPKPNVLDQRRRANSQRHWCSGGEDAEYLRFLLWFQLRVGVILSFYVEIKFRFQLRRETATWAW